MLPGGLGRTQGSARLAKRAELPTVAQGSRRVEEPIAHIQDDHPVAKQSEMHALHGLWVGAQQPSLLEPEGLEVGLQHVVQLLASVHPLAPILRVVQARLGIRQLQGGA